MRRTRQSQDENRGKEIHHGFVVLKKRYQPEVPSLHLNSEATLSLV